MWGVKNNPKDSSLQQRSLMFVIFSQSLTVQSIPERRRVWCFQKPRTGHELVGVLPAEVWQQPAVGLLVPHTPLCARVSALSICSDARSASG